MTRWLLAALVAALMVVLPVSPANAGILCDRYDICGSIKHLMDPGYDKPLRVRCRYGDPDSGQNIPEGRWDRCKDVDQIYVRADEEWWCRTTTSPYGTLLWRQWDARGWHKVRDSDHYLCRVQRD